MIEARVSAMVLTGWESVRVSRSVLSLAGEFELSGTAHWPGEANPYRIRPGSSIEILHDGEVLITGYVDTVSPRYDSGSHGVTISGRSRTADLDDCCPVAGSQEWRSAAGIDTQTIADALCTPYGCAVSIEAPEIIDARSQSFAVDATERVAEPLARLADRQGWLLTDTPSGDVLFTQPGGSTLTAGATAQAAAPGIVQGVNVLSGSGSFSDRTRYSEVRIRGARAQSAEDYGIPCVDVSATVLDDELSRTRILAIGADAQVSDAQAARRAAWECARRAADGNRLSYTLAGWRRPDGELWAPNQLAWVSDGLMAVEAYLIIASITYSYDDGGEVVSLELVPEAGLQPIAVYDQLPKKKPARGIGPRKQPASMLIPELAEGV